MVVNNWIAANSILITLAITIIVLLYFVFVIIQTIRKKRRFVSQLYIILLILGLMFLIFLTYHASEIEGADWGQVILMIGLVSVTAVYASSTEKQAEASVKMAEEMREQRYVESLPILIPEVTGRSFLGNDAKIEPNEVDYGTLQTGVGLEVIWRNLGKGVAINSRFSFWSVPLDSSPDKVLYFPAYESSFLEIGGHKKIIISDTWKYQTIDLSKALKPQFIAEYNDIYERIITTVQEFHIESENGRKRAFLGELYFTINGKRLGKEIIKND